MAGLETVDAGEPVRPADLVGRDVPIPAAELRDRMHLVELRVALAQRRLGGALLIADRHLGRQRLTAGPSRAGLSRLT